ncbi:TonB-dependent receptor [Prevotella cerevisiae]|uniref:TonB-dependent receptor n=1 Tax=Segatella cerevisiae TaxID=2053716 RepID=A0ABT1BW74_9BACT|nr:TonB-dependent receptor [Segatella cerevisiae]MCO6025335.1 TonB-dependent receptor [Segatella cerevisiae]
MKNVKLKFLFSGLFVFLTGTSGYCGAYASDLVRVEQQAGMVTGYVLDEKDEPIIGATIKSGSKDGTVTDINGKFSLNVPAGTKLTVSYIGYKPQTVKAGNSPLKIHLVADDKTLNEVIVVGYGTVKRKNFTGSVATVDVAKSPVSLTPATDAMATLRGTVSGIYVAPSQWSGRISTLQVRGQKAVNGGSAPLIILDGMIFTGQRRDIDPNTIESISVLKDATSLAAYGSQAANGVVMITTKKGVEGKPRISFNSSWGLSSPTFKPDVLSPSDYVKKVNLQNGLAEDADPTWMKSFEYSNYKAGKTTNWFDYSTRTGVVRDYNASVSGASKNINYFFSGSFINQTGVVIGDGFKRTNLLMRLQSDITKWLQIGTESSYTYNDYLDPTPYNLYEAVRLSPYGRAERPDGAGLEKYPVNEGTDRTNPLWNAKSGTYSNVETYDVLNLRGHLLLKCPWIDGLTFKMSGNSTIENDYYDNFIHEGYYVQEGDSEDRYSPSTISQYLSLANGYNDRYKNVYWVWDNILDYTHEFGPHFIDITLVYTRDSKTEEGHGYTASDFSSLGNTTLGYWGLNYATNVKIDVSSYDKHNDVGYLARLNYSYKDTYHLDLSVRRDGSSVFGDNNKWGIFPAVGMAWTVSNESFMKKVTPVSYLKLKFSWGKNGSQNLSPYETLSQITLGEAGGFSYPFGNTSEASWAQRIKTLGNKDLAWQKTQSINYGFELGLLKDRITFDFDGYFSKTTDQIFSRSIPVIINGLTSLEETMGQINNSGIELTLNTKNIETRDFQWESQLIYSLNRNKLKSLYGDGKDDVTNSLFLGKSLGAIYGYKNIGIIQCAYDASGKPAYDANGNLEVADADKAYAAANGAKPGDVKFEDVNGDGKITSSDRKILGYTVPNFTMSLGNTLTYKNLQLYFLFTGTFGGDGYGRSTNIYAYRTASDFYGDNNLNHGWWTPENRSNKYPSVTYNNDNYTPVQGFGFVRLSDLTLSYSFTQPWVRNLRISNLQVYVACKNLFTITNWTGGDPEVQQTLTSNKSYQYPVSKTVSFGLKLTF